ncbi:MAG: sensor domain-containing diguanylate cyclase [Desulfobulbaceae bacterium]|nr:sensor domain-containing diguanylate cyclase [Desulfobulbaceae bacterium]
MASKPNYSDLEKKIIELENDLEVQARKMVRLERDRVRLKTILESATHAIVVVNDRGLIVEWPSQAELLCGWGRDDIIGKPIFSIMPARYREKHRGLLEKVLNGDHGLNFGKRIETTILYKDELEVPVELAVSLTRIGGRQEFNLFMHDITERKNYEAQLHRVSITDELTDLFNRRGFMGMAARQLKIAYRNKENIFLLFADFDNMKWINDNLGHQIGDLALMETAAILKKTFREADLIGRVGGDEFIVLVADNNTRKTGKMVMARLEENIAEANKRPGRRFKVMLSTGTVFCDHRRSYSIDDLMIKADKLMYRSKKEKQTAGLYSHI